MRCRVLLDSAGLWQREILNSLTLVTPLLIQGLADVRVPSRVPAKAGTSGHLPSILRFTD